MRPPVEKLTMPATNDISEAHACRGRWRTISTPAPGWGTRPSFGYQRSQRAPTDPRVLVRLPTKLFL